MIKIEKDKKYLVTGGSGFLGQYLIKYILEEGGLVRAIARNEGKLVELKELYPSIEIQPCDIADICGVKTATHDITGIFHLAASKHVGLSEKYVKETINTNIIGTVNILNETLHNPNIKFILGISTDKAAQVVGVYGATKMLMERLFKQYEDLNNNCQYRIVRYGNVLYSTGSVLCKWKTLIQQGKPVIITEHNATRFFWSVEQAIDLIKDCLLNAIDTKPYCPNMKSIMIGNLLTAMIEKYSNGQIIPITHIGLQAGENLHETVLDNGPYSNQVPQYTIEEIKLLI